MGEPMDGRCTDYCNDPAVVYHAHDLPRCKNVADVQIKGRWLCNTHARLATTEAALAEAQDESLERARQRDLAVNNYITLDARFRESEAALAESRGEVERLRVALSKIAQYDSQWEGQRVNDMPNRHQLIRWAYEGLEATGD